MKSKISAVILSYNSEDVIEDCLESVKFCDEIILVDAGSNDKTLKIAEKYSAKILNFDKGDYAGSRNLGLKKAAFDWIIYIDTDERISPELQKNIIKVLSIPEPFSAYKIQRKNFYFGKHEWPKIEKLERLFKREKIKNWYGKIHESPIVDGKIGTLEGFLLHYTHRDLSSMVKKTMEWSKIEAELRFKASHPKMAWWRFPRVMASAFFDSYIKQQGYRAGAVGIIESLYQAFSIFVTYARLWEMQKRHEIS